MNNKLIPCPDGTMADPSIGCVKTPGTVVSPESGIAELILKISVTAMSLVIAAAVLMLIYGGIVYALAAGNDEKIHKSKQIMFWSVVGLIVALLARTLVVYILGIVT